MSALSSASVDELGPSGVRALENVYNHQGEIRPQVIGNDVLIEILKALLRIEALLKGEA